MYNPERLTLDIKIPTHYYNMRRFVGQLEQLYDEYHKSKRCIPDLVFENLKDVIDDLNQHLNNIIEEEMFKKFNEQCTLWIK